MKLVWGRAGLWVPERLDLMSYHQMFKEPMVHNTMWGIPNKVMTAHIISIGDKPLSWGNQRDSEQKPILI